MNDQVNDDMPNDDTGHPAQAPNSHDPAGAEAATAPLGVDDTRDGPHRPGSHAQGAGDRAQSSAQGAGSGSGLDHPCAVFFGHLTMDGKTDVEGATAEAAVITLRKLAADWNKDDRLRRVGLPDPAGFSPDEWRDEKKKLPWILCGKMEVPRGTKNVLWRSMLALDIDNKTNRATLDDIAQKMKALNLAAWGYTTASHTDKTPRSRWLIPLTRVVRRPEHYASTLRSLAAELKIGDPIGDDSTQKSWAQIVYLPAYIGERRPQMVVIEGNTFDPVIEGRDLPAAIDLCVRAYSKAASRHMSDVFLPGALRKAGLSDTETEDFMKEVHARLKSSVPPRELDRYVAAAFKKDLNDVGGAALLVAQAGWSWSDLALLEGLLGNDNPDAGEKVQFNIVHEASRRAVLTALADRELLYLMNGRAVRPIEVPQAQAILLEQEYGIKVPKEQRLLIEMNATTVAHIINANMQLIRMKRGAKGKLKEVRVYATKGDAATLLEAQDYGSIREHLRPLLGISQTPVIDMRGEITDTPGYSAKHSVWIEWPHGELSIPEKPTREDAEKALALINDRLLTELSFDEPFEADRDKRGNLLKADWETDEFKPVNRVAAIAAVITSAARASMTKAPALVINAHRERTGKNKFIDACAIIATGNRPTTYALGHGSEEHAKRIPAALVLNPPFLLFTNVDHAVFSHDLEAVITDGEVRLRLYGTTDGERSIVSRGVLAFTGNKIAMPAALARRCLRVTLNAHVENPDRRVFLKDEPGALALKHRSEVLGAAFTIIRWGRQNYEHFAKGTKNLALGSFPQWAMMIKKPLFELTGVDLDATVDDGIEEGAFFNADAELLSALGAWANDPGRKGYTPLSAEARGKLRVPDGCELFTVSQIMSALTDRSILDMSDTEKRLFLVLSERKLIGDKAKSSLGYKLHLIEKVIQSGHQLVSLKTQGQGRTRAKTYYVRGVSNDPTISKHEDDGDEVDTHAPERPRDSGENGERGLPGVWE
jgi:hypothetical protein